MSRDEAETESLADDSNYNNAHRAFLQAFMSRSVMTADEMKPVLATVMTAQGDITPPIITSTLQTINARLAPLDYEIRSTRDQVSKTTIYALVNTTSDALTQLATTFSAEEIAYIKRVLDCMFETNNTRVRELMAVTSREAAQLAKAPRGSRQSQVNGNGEDGEAEVPVKGIDMRDADVVLRTLVSQSFFRKSRVAGNEYYTLAPRGLLELRAYLKETYNETADPEFPDEEPVIRIRNCEGCGEIVTVGIRCSKRDCGVRFHDACAAQYFRGVRGEKACPTCRTEWTGELLVGPRAADTGQRRATGGSSAGGRVLQGARRSEVVDFGSDIEDEDE